MRFLIAPVLAGLVAAAPAAAGTVRYARLVAAQIAFQTLPAEQRDKIVLRTVVTHDDSADRRPIHLWVQDGDTRTEIPLTDTGAIDMPLRPDWIGRDVTVQTDQPQSSLHADLDIGIVLPASRPIPVAYLRDAVRQTQFVLNAGTRQATGFLAMFVTPKVRGLKITVAECCGQIVTLTGGAQAENIQQDANGTVSLDDATLAAHDGGALAVTAPLVTIDPWVR